LSRQRDEMRIGQTASTKSDKDQHQS